jgi:LAO/AO transport system kinase
VGLKVRRAVALKKKPKKSCKEYLEGLAGGDVGTLAQAISLIESRTREDRALARELMQTVSVSSAKASLRIGMAGSLSVTKRMLGKSLGSAVMTGSAEKCAYLLIESTSYHTGGSLLAGKTRFSDLQQQEGRCYVRSFAAGHDFRQTALVLRDVIQLCEAAGYQKIFIDGEGGYEFECALRELVDVFIMVTSAVGTSEMFGISCGIEELADLIVLTGAEEEITDQLVLAQRALQNRLALRPQTLSSQPPRVFICGTAVENCSAQLGRALQQSSEGQSGLQRIAARRARQQAYWIRQAVVQAILEQVWAQSGVEQHLTEVTASLMGGKGFSLPQAVDHVLERAGLSL